MATKTKLQSGVGDKFLACLAVVLAVFLLYISGTITFEVARKTLHDPLMGWFGVALIGCGLVAALKKRRNFWVMWAFILINAALNAGGLAERFFGADWARARLQETASKSSGLVEALQRQAKAQEAMAQAAEEGFKAEMATGLGSRAKSHLASQKQAREAQVSISSQEVEIAREQLTLFKGLDTQEVSPVVLLVNHSVPEGKRLYAWVPLFVLLVLSLDPLAIWLLVGAKQAFMGEEVSTQGRLSHAAKVRLLLKGLEELDK